jgi:dihydroneopterin aldolase
MGKIVIEEMEFYAFHGHYKEEQIVGNRFLVDLELKTDLTVAAASDSLSNAVNYQQAYQIIKSEMSRTKSNLLENIGKRILDALFEKMDGIEKATIRVRKLNPPMGGTIKSVGIEMSRKKKNR